MAIDLPFKCAWFIHTNVPFLTIPCCIYKGYYSLIYTNVLPSGEWLAGQITLQGSPGDFSPITTFWKLFFRLASLWPARRVALLEVPESL